ncbi:unnamed protein product [Symbiodinium sp. KB8]|nr:unnamed protein product [Symbiodinium sp. KB8]
MSRRSSIGVVEPHACEEQARPGLQELPDESLHVVLGMLSARDLFRLGCVNWEWLSRADDQRIWLPLLMQDFRVNCHVSALTPTDASKRHSEDAADVSSVISGGGAKRAYKAAMKAHQEKVRELMRDLERQHREELQERVKDLTATHPFLTLIPRALWQDAWSLPDIQVAATKLQLAVAALLAIALVYTFGVTGACFTLAQGALLLASNTALIINVLAIGEDRPRVTLRSHLLRFLLRTGLFPSLTHALESMTDRTLRLAFIAALFCHIPLTLLTHFLPAGLSTSNPVSLLLQTFILCLLPIRWGCLVVLGALYIDQGETAWKRGISNIDSDAQTTGKLACGGLLASQLGLMLHMLLTGGYPSMSHDLLPALWQALQVICVAVTVVAGGLLAGMASAHYTRVWWERNPGNIETWTSADVQRSPLHAMDRGERFYDSTDFKELAGVGGVAAGVLAVGHFALLPLLDWFGLLHAPAAPYIILHAAAAGEQLLQAYRLVAMVILLCTVAVWLLCSHCSWVLAAVGERPPPGWLQHIQLIGLPSALLVWLGGEWLALATGAGPLAVMDPATHIGTVRLVVLTDPVMDFVGDALYTVLLSVPYWVVMVGVPGVCWGVVLAVYYVLTLPLYCVGAALWQAQAGVVTTAEASHALAMSPLQVCWDVYSPLAIAGRLWGAITHATWLLTTLCLGEAWGAWLVGWSAGVSAASTVPSNMTLAMCVWARVAGAGLNLCPPRPSFPCYWDDGPSACLAAMPSDMCLDGVEVALEDFPRQSAAPDALAVGLPATDPVTPAMSVWARVSRATLGTCPPLPKLQCGADEPLESQGTRLPEHWIPPLLKRLALVICISLSMLGILYFTCMLLLLCAIDSFPYMRRRARPKRKD